jgi:DNA repair exonuclease SbcCD ATPase subunit
MLKLKKYSFSGAGRFVQKQTVDLESRDTLIQIDGENTNTGGSSGAGKSTTVEVLAYLLGISEVPATQLQSRITTEPIWVQGEFEGGITITRSKKDGLIIETPDETISGNSKLAEEKLDQIIGVSRSLLQTMCYKRQKQGGFFLNLTPKQSYDFLIECLDLQECQVKIDKLEDAVKNKYKPLRIELESSVNTTRQNIEHFTTLLEQKTLPQKPEIPNLDELRTKLNIVNQQIELEKNKKDDNLLKIGLPPQKKNATFEKQADIDLVDSKIAELRLVMSGNYRKKEQEVEQATAIVNQIQNGINEIEFGKNENQRNINELESLRQQINHIKENKCPTCMREWQQTENTRLTTLETKAGEFLPKIDQYQQKVAKLPQSKLMLEKANEILAVKKSTIVNEQESIQLQGLEDQKRSLLNEKQNTEMLANQGYLEEYNKWNQLNNFIIQEFSLKEKALIQNKHDTMQVISKAETEQKAYEQALAVFHQDIGNLIDKKDTMNKSLQDKVQQLADMEKKIILSEESIRLIKHFTLQKFQDTLDYIGQRATEIINNIPNMANAVVYFENAKETKSGKVKNEVNAVVNLEGDTAIPIKTLSGGERTSADFAIDLAVGEMIENMTQKGVNFLIIDEGFDGLDSISKIQCLEILKTLSTDKKILMVDHSSEVKEMVGDIIKVVRIKEESFIQ